MRAVTYARVSGDDSKKEGRNLRGQLDLCREYCQEKNYTVIDELAEDDRGASGASWDLPKLNKALDMAREGQFDVLVTRELDRFARGLAKQLVVEAEFKRLGVEVEYVLEEYDDSPEGRLSKNIRAVIAEFEREKIRQRMVRGRRQKVKGGSVMVHGHAPFGYRIHKENGKTSLVICEQEAEIVRRIFELYISADKPSLSEVAKKMQGTPTCSDLRRSPSNPKVRKYGQWSLGGVSHLLDKKCYTGVWCYADDPDLTVEIPAIISQETWEKAQKYKKRNARLSKRNAKYKYLMGKRLTCSECGSKLAGRSVKKRNGNGVRLYYTCQARYRLATECTMSKCFRADKVDEAVWDWIQDLFSDPERLSKLVTNFIEDEQASKQALIDRVEVTRRLRDENQQKLRRLLDNFLDDPRMDKEWFHEKKDALENRYWSLEMLLHDLEMTLFQWQSLREYYQEIGGDPEHFGRFVMGMKLETTDKDELIDKLDVRGTLFIENGEQKVHVRCTLGEKVLSIDDTNNEIR